ncbi:MAG: YfhO family protein, partial [Planctomycetota bacterium]
RAVGRRSGRWFELPNSLSRARLVTRVVRAVPAGEFLPLLDETSAAADLAVDLPPGDPGSVQILSDRPGDVRLRVSAPAARLLVLSESYHSGWRVRVEGEEQAAIRVNGDFLGALVDRGTREVAFVFRPASRRLGGIVSTAGLLAIAGLGVFAFRRSPQALAP